MMNTVSLRALLAFIIFFTRTLSADTNLQFLFAHGLGGSHRNAFWYQPGNPLNWAIMPEQCYSFDFPEVRYDGPLDSKQVYLAQSQDIEVLYHAHKAAAHSDSPIDEVVFIGKSRGAAAVITYLGSKARDILPLPKVKACVFESPFASIEHIIDYQVKLRYIGWVPGIRTLIGYYVKLLYPNYNRDGIKPIDAIASIDKNTPMLFVHSIKDGLISPECSIDLFKKTKDLGFPHTHLLLLDDGIHGRYQKGSEAFKYKAGVHAFYELYGVEPHDKELARQGKAFLIS